MEVFQTTAIFFDIGMINFDNRIEQRESLGQNGRNILAALLRHFLQTSVGILVNLDRAPDDVHATKPIGPSELSRGGGRQVIM